MDKNTGYELDKEEIERFRDYAKTKIQAEIYRQLDKVRAEARSKYQQLTSDEINLSSAKYLKGFSITKIRNKRTFVLKNNGKLKNRCILPVKRADTYYTDSRGVEKYIGDTIYSVRENVVKDLLSVYDLNERQKCLMLATFFFTLVANTPMDDDYKGKRTIKYATTGRISLKEFKKSPLTSTNKATTPTLRERVQEQFEMKSKEVTVTHKADNHSVRGDWILKYKGCNFKAFKTEKEENSTSLPSKLFYFEKDWFLSSSFSKSENYIDKMAEIIFNATKKSKTKSDTFIYENVNPRVEQLEYGGYYDGTSKPLKGVKYGYKHGVKDNYTYQAPYGFIRITEAYWNTIKTTKSKKNPFMNKRRPLNVSKLKSKVVKDIFKAMKSNPRDIDGTLAATWVDIAE